MYLIFDGSTANLVTWQNRFVSFKQLFCLHQVGKITNGYAILKLP